MYEEKITLVFDGEPIPKQSVRIRAIAYIDKITGKAKAFIQTYQTAKIKNFEKDLAVQAREQLPKGFVMFTGPLCVSVEMQFFPLKGMTRKIRDRIDMGSIVYKSTSPDLTDNLMKGIFDALEGIVYKTDGQISVIKDATKIYNNNPKITVIIEQIQKTADPLFN